MISTPYISTYSTVITASKTLDTGGLKFTYTYKSKNTSSQLLYNSPLPNTSVKKDNSLDKQNLKQQEQVEHPDRFILPCPVETLSTYKEFKNTKRQAAYDYFLRPFKRRVLVIGSQVELQLAVRSLVRVELNGEGDRLDFIR